MIKKVTADEIRSWPVVDGWYVSPDTGDHIWIGNNTVIGDGTEIGVGTTIGAGTKIGNWTTIGARTKIGDWVTVNISPLVIYGSKYIVNAYSGPHLRIGCEIHPLKDWARLLHSLIVKHGETPEQEAELREYIKMAKIWYKQNGHLFYNSEGGGEG